MSGTPTETELQTQLKNSIDILEKTRVFADGVAISGGELDVLEQSLEGEFTPSALTNASSRFRAGMSSLVDPGRALEFISPILFDYGQLMAFGGGYQDLGRLMRSLYEHFEINSLSVESRAITYDTSATTSDGFGGAIIGDGTMTRLTKDEYNHDLEACHVEVKRFRCRADQNSGVRKHAEEFEHIGDTPAIDSLLRSTFGSGEQARAFLRSRHAGSGAGGSLLRNSSFSTFDTDATPKFSGWTATGTGDLAQDTTNFFRSHPGASTDASMEMTVISSNTLTVKQLLTEMTTGRLDPDRPYFLRVMVNKTVGTAAGGSINIRMGSQTVTSTIAGLGTNWQEMLIPADTNTWFKNFNEDPFDVEIEWAGGTGGTMLFDDAIFTTYDLVDGTFWLMRGGATPFLLDDSMLYTDTGGAPATGKVQYWFWVAGLGYLPHSGTPTLADP